MDFEKFWKAYRKIIFFAGALILFMLIMTLIQTIIFRTTGSGTGIHQLYNLALLQLQEKSWFWLFVISLAGSTIFLALPVHFFYIYYIIDGADPLATTVVAVLAVALGRTVNYLVGHLFSGFVKKKLLKEDLKVFNKRFSKWGGGLLIAGNFIPFFPTEPLTVFMGSIKYNFWKFQCYNIGGKLLELLLLVFFLKYFLVYGIHLMTFNYYHFIKNIFI